MNGPARTASGEPRRPGVIAAAHPSLARLWYGIAAAPLAWTVAELAGYILAGRSCALRWPGRDFGVAHPSWWVAGMSSALVLLAASGLFIAWGNVAATANAEHSRARFMARFGVLASALFLLGTALFLLPPLMLHPCSQAR